jgi:phosphohistidine phosphatase
MISKIVIVRHAEAEAYQIDDHGRRLTEKGRKDALQTKNGLLSAGDQAWDLVIASDASRAKETAAIIFDDHPRIQFTNEIYSSHDAQALIVNLNREFQIAGESSVAIVGHNPTLSDLVGYLSGTDVHLNPAQWVVLVLRESQTADRDLIFELPHQWRIQSTV